MKTILSDTFVTLSLSGILFCHQDAKALRFTKH